MLGAASLAPPKTGRSRWSKALPAVPGAGSDDDNDNDNADHDTPNNNNNNNNNNNRNNHNNHSLKNSYGDGFDNCEDHYAIYRAYATPSPSASPAASPIPTPAAMLPSAPPPKDLPQLPPPRTSSMSTAEKPKKLDAALPALPIAAAAPRVDAPPPSGPPTMAIPRRPVGQPSTSTRRAPTAAAAAVAVAQKEPASPTESLSSILSAYSRSSAGESIIQSVGTTADQSTNPSWASNQHSDANALSSHQLAPLASSALEPTNYNISTSTSIAAHATGATADTKPAVTATAAAGLAAAGGSSTTTTTAITPAITNTPVTATAVPSSSTNAVASAISTSPTITAATASLFSSSVPAALPVSTTTATQRPQTQHGVAPGSAADDRALPPPPPSKDDKYKHKPASPSQSVVPVKAIDTTSPPQQQLWRRRSDKTDRSIDLPDLKIVSSHGSTAATQTASQSVAQPAVQSVAQPATASVAVVAAATTAPATAPQPVASRPAPALPAGAVSVSTLTYQAPHNVKANAPTGKRKPCTTVPALALEREREREPTKEPVKTPKLDKVPEQKPVEEPKPKSTMGSGTSKMDRLKDKLHSVHRRGKQSVDIGANGSSTRPSPGHRPPTPEYQKQDVKTPMIDAFNSPLSPASSPEASHQASPEIPPVVPSKDRAPVNGQGSMKGASQPTQQFPPRSASISKSTTTSPQLGQGSHAVSFQPTSQYPPRSASISKHTGLAANHQVDQGTRVSPHQPASQQQPPRSASLSKSTTPASHQVEQGTQPASYQPATQQHASRSASVSKSSPQLDALKIRNNPKQKLTVDTSVSWTKPDPPPAQVEPPVAEPAPPMLVPEPSSDHQVSPGNGSARSRTPQSSDVPTRFPPRGSSVRSNAHRSFEQSRQSLDQDPRIVHSDSQGPLYIGRDGTLYPEMKIRQEADPRACAFPIQEPQLLAEGTIITAPPLKESHFSCYQGHKSMNKRANKHYPLSCPACDKSDSEDRWVCTFCHLRICDSCMTTLNANGRSLQRLVEARVSEPPLTGKAASQTLSPVMDTGVFA